MKALNLFWLLFVTLNCYGQQNYKALTNRLLNYINVVSNAAVLYLNTQLGTISNENGDFTINAKLKDTLLIASIQYQPKK